MDLLLNPEDVTAWDNAATNLALNNDEFKFDKPRNPVYFGATDPLPATWTFKTREGGRGIFQILGSDHDEPKAVRIRYRMLGKGSK
jgi:hypothetical protein